ncbi:MAG: hypothetical protein LUE98_16905 [Tannerellaceae bacterium]|nr:hypothetical protein [Tannerellaceae bacterium]
MTAVHGVIDLLQIGSLKIKNYPVAIVVDSGLIKEKGNLNEVDKEKVMVAYHKIITPLISETLTLGIPFLRLLNNIEFNFIDEKIVINNMDISSIVTNPFLIIDGNLCFNGNMNNNLSTLTMDTGATNIDLVISSRFHEKYADSFGEKEEGNFNWMSVGGILNFNSYQLSDINFSIGTNAITIPKIFVVDGEGFEKDKKFTSETINIDGFAGLNLLKRYNRVVFDFSKATLGMYQ